MSSNHQQQVVSAFAEINRLMQDSNADFERILVLSDVILSHISNDSDALRCKIVSLIHLNRFEDALQTMLPSATTAAGMAMVYERAYCQYRLFLLDESLATIANAPSDLQSQLHMKQLYAQVLYRKESFRDAVNVYKTIQVNSEQEKVELDTNLTASVVGAIINDPDWVSSDLVNFAPSLSTYELCYNAACLDIAKYQLSSASSKLQKAEALCRKTLEEEGFDEQDIVAEIGMIQVQRAVVLQLLGNSEEAMQAYSEYLKSKPSDIGVIAVASNNIVALNKDKDTFDSKKKIKATTADGLERKLSSFQRRAMAINRCLLFLYLNQGDQCRQLLDTLKEQYPDHDAPSLILASLFIREKKIQQAYDVLKAAASSSSSKSHSLGLHLALAQMGLSQNDLTSAIDTLRSLKVKHRIGVVTTVVGLLMKQGAVEEAKDVLTEAISWWDSQKNRDRSQYLSLLSAAGKFFLQQSMWAQATSVFEKLYKEDRTNSSALAYLVLAVSHVDPVVAEQYAANLPSFSSGEDALDVDSLENVTLGTFGRSSKRAAAESTESALTSNTTTQTLKKKGPSPPKKKKRRGKLPKNYDPKILPDPERWIPKRERSSYRKKKKKDTGKGASQGSASNVSSADAGTGGTGSVGNVNRGINKSAAASSSSSSSSTASSSASATTTAQVAPAPPASSSHKNHHKKKKR